MGLDWFENTKAGIFPDQKLLKFRENNVYLNNDEVVEDMEVDSNVLLSRVIEEDSALNRKMNGLLSEKRRLRKEF